jgi:hypothetical protein
MERILNIGMIIKYMEANPIRLKVTNATMGSILFK